MKLHEGAQNISVQSFAYIFHFFAPHFPPQFTNKTLSQHYKALPSFTPQSRSQYLKHSIQTDLDTTLHFSGSIQADL
jgi:hypothetical protein